MKSIVAVFCGLAWLAGCVEQAEEAPQPPETTVRACHEAPKTTEGFDPALAEALQGALEGNLADAAAPGAAAIVVLPGVGTWFGAAGVADTRTGAAMGAQARFRVGSITKTFTAAAVLQNVEAGRWSLDDPVDDWVPGWDLGPEVTLGRLLNHTSGVFNYTDDGAFLGRAYAETPPEDVVRFALSHGSPFEPGEGFLYSNTGYFLLGMALEAVEGKPFHEVIRTRFIEPFGLVDTFMEGFEPGRCEVTPGHVLGDTSPTEGFSSSWSWAAGGLVAPVEDLCRWGDHLFRGGVIDEAQLGGMILPETLSIRAEDPYGLGIQSRVRSGMGVVGHSGSTMGFNGELFVHRQSGVCVAIQTNDFFGSHEVLSLPIWAVLADAGFTHNKKIRHK